MKHLSTLIICNLLLTSLVAQQSRIENAWIRLSLSTDTLIVNYDLTGKRPAFDVKLSVSGQNGEIYKPLNITGEVGNLIQPGKNKTIFWDMKADQFDLSGKNLMVKVTGKVYIPESVKKKIWIPWLYIAAGLSAATGTYAHFQANRIYDDYQVAALTDKAENLYKDYERMLMIRNGAFGAAGGFGIAGIAVHIRHIQKKNALTVSLLPVPDGAVVGLNLNF